MPPGEGNDQLKTGYVDRASLDAILARGRQLKDRDRATKSGIFDVGAAKEAVKKEGPKTGRLILGSALFIMDSSHLQRETSKLIESGATSIDSGLVNCLTKISTWLLKHEGASRPDDRQRKYGDAMKNLAGKLISMGKSNEISMDEIEKTSSVLLGLERLEFVSLAFDVQRAGDTAFITKEIKERPTSFQHWSSKDVAQLERIQGYLQRGDKLLRAEKLKPSDEKEVDKIQRKEVRLKTALKLAANVIVLLDITTKANKTLEDFQNQIKAKVDEIEIEAQDIEKLEVRQQETKVRDHVLRTMASQTEADGTLTTEAQRAAAAAEAYVEKGDQGLREENEKSQRESRRELEKIHESGELEAVVDYDTEAADALSALFG